ncbi:YqaA family protein [Candidatus Puniceispirillum sp.]|uniref:YqaA family protein n=1 Tax=Candidatus Puniceispirillum sp. TaxID=2026719 RepID=UPI003F69E80D
MVSGSIFSSSMAWAKAAYDRGLKTAGTPFATRFMLAFAVLESIIIPIPVDPLLVAVVLAKPMKWLRMALACTLASVIGGAGGWALGAILGLGIHDILAMFPEKLAAPTAFAAVEAGFASWGLILVFIGAFSPLPYKVIAVSAGLLGFGLLPFLLVSLIGRGLRFVIVAAIARHHGDPKTVIGLLSLLIGLIVGGIWLTY